MTSNSSPSRFRLRLEAGRGDLESPCETNIEAAVSVSSNPMSSDYSRVTTAAVRDAENASLDLRLGFGTSFSSSAASAAAAAAAALPSSRSSIGSEADDEKSTTTTKPLQTDTTFCRLSRRRTRQRRKWSCLGSGGGGNRPGNTIFAIFIALSGILLWKGEFSRKDSIRMEI
jgi:hypothetical protein